MTKTFDKNNYAFFLSKYIRIIYNNNNNKRKYTNVKNKCSIVRKFYVHRV